MTPCGARDVLFESREDGRERREPRLERLMMSRHKSLERSSILTRLHIGECGRAEADRRRRPERGTPIVYVRGRARGRATNWIWGSQGANHSLGDASNRAFGSIRMYRGMNRRHVYFIRVTTRMTSPIAAVPSGRIAVAPPRTKRTSFTWEVGIVRSKVASVGGEPSSETDEFDPRE